MSSRNSSRECREMPPNSQTKTLLQFGKSGSDIWVKYPREKVERGGVCNTSSGIQELLSNRHEALRESVCGNDPSNTCIKQFVSLCGKPASEQCVKKNSKKLKGI